MSKKKKGKKRKKEKKIVKFLNKVIEKREKCLKE